jgi:hypothetical protein
MSLDCSPTLLLIFRLPRRREELGEGPTKQATTSQYPYQTTHLYLILPCPTLSAFNPTLTSPKMAARSSISRLASTLTANPLALKTSRNALASSAIARTARSSAPSMLVGGQKRMASAESGPQMMVSSSSCYTRQVIDN